MDIIIGRQLKDFLSICVYFVIDGFSQWGQVMPTVSNLSATDEMEHFSFVAISRSSCMISGENVRAILSLRGCPEGGLAMRGSYNASY
jgi:hypothetical protein